MATLSSNTLIPTTSPAAAIQGWATFVENLLVTTGGWVVTADTGQTLPGSLPAATSAGQKVGYRVYKMNDTLQATAPVFVRIDFGSATANVVIVNMWFTIGTGSDGAGNITGVVLNSQPVPLGTDATVATGNSYGSAGTNRFVWALFVQATNTSQLIHIVSLERSKDSSGNDTSDGLMFIIANPATSPYGVTYSWYLVLAGGSQPTVETGVSFINTMQNPTQSFAPGDVGIGLIFCFKGIAQQPGTQIVAANSNDVAAEGSFSMTVYGATRTYQQVRSQFLRAGSTTTVDAANRVCIRYD